MHSLTIWFGPAAAFCQLLFKTEEKATLAYNAYVDFNLSEGTSGSLIGSDDFGQSFAFDLKTVSGILLEDLDQSQLGQIERGLHQARSQAKAQVRGMEDPVIKESLRKQQMGPAVMSPIPGGRFNG